MRVLELEGRETIMVCASMFGRMRGIIMWLVSTVGRVTGLYKPFVVY
jgi:hypothetical protein